MAKKSTGHPSRVPGHMKFVRNLDVQREAEKSKKKKPPFDPLDLSSNDWSTKKP